MWWLKRRPKFAPGSAAGACRMLFQWHLTDRCNLHCAHCYQTRPAPRELPFPDLLLVLKQFESLLEHLERAEGRLYRGHITLTGGELFLRPDLWELLGVLARQSERFSFALLTNGTCIDRAAASRLHELGPRFVQVSVEGSAATHDRIRGAGNHARTVDAIRELVRAGVPTLIAFTAHRGNWREFGEVAELGRRLKVARVWADRLIPAGAGASLELLDRAETHAFLQSLRREQSNGGGTEIALHRALQFLEGGTPYRCSAGSRLLAIQPDGDVYPCRRLPLRAGNLMETPLVEIYRDNLMLQQLRDTHQTPDACGECSHRAACGGGLRCLAYAVTGSLREADPGCWLAGQPGHAAHRA